jgi:phenylpropionate dioxygenase-like ring-hydroxylating dioxygenase large terminal subunit
MLSREDNELITRTGPDTPMGELMRRFWLPALLSSELAEADGPPVRLRLLGEDLIAFRDSSGRVGLLAEHCPHRGASLFFGRNEEHGLRCVYHGWKFDRSGACVDQPNEPPDSTFKQRIRATAYPCVERAGVVWAYLGPDPASGPPELEWARVPERQVVVNKAIASCNYLQAMEGNFDSSHISFLHRSLPEMRPPAGTVDPVRPGSTFNLGDRAPRYTVVERDYGLMLAARRDAGDDRYYWRISQWLMPCFDMIGHDPGAMAMSAHAAVPMDDEHAWFWAIRWEGDRSMTDEERARWSGEEARVPVIPGTFWPRANRANDYLLDRAVQRTRTFTGIPGIGTQDLAMTESMGPIVDHTAEHLGSSDLAIIRVRQALLQAARDLQRGIDPYAAHHPEVFHIRPTSAVLPRTVAFDQDDGVRQATLARA